MSPPNLRPQRIPKRKMTRKTRILSDEDLYVERVQDSDPGLQKVALQGMRAFGYSSEDVQMVIETMASQGKEPTFCMGDDIPLAILSQRPHMLYDYFKQRFAQVTNPAIDPLREGLVMSLEVNIGKRRNILEVGPENASQVILSSPVLNEGELESLLNDAQLKPHVLPTFFDIHKGVDGSLEKPCIGFVKLLMMLFKMVANCLFCLTDLMSCINVKDVVILELFSLNMHQGEATRPAIPILLAVGAVHQHLIQNGLRMSASIIVDTAQCFSTHQFACLIGYGASGVCPYLALETCRQWRLSNKTVNLMRNGKMPTVTIEQAQKNFCKAVRAGLLKILSKMGISLLSSYCGAQIFEIYGLGKGVVDLAFCGSISSIGGLTFDELARETLSFWVKAFSEDTAKRLENFGFIQFRPGGEYHGNNPEMSKLLHKAVRQKNESAFSVYQQHLANRPVNVLRDLIEFKSDRAPIPVGKVEPAVSIVQRFCTGGMSLGAISRETHEATAIAMNRIGGKSNSGEGGEDPIRWKPLADVVDGYSPTLPHLKGLQNGDTATSAIKQVASGRFGVTPTFLVNADQLEIKIAQGAKPGEGGQLPGKKVSAYIARLRNSKPGVPLISPPPHHDIYSIEDLAQLIYDLHQVNPKAKVSVKLVAEAGIGTVASGVAKGNADVIQISGHDGGTGTSPISSIKHAGGPWELGLTETHQTLIENGLRERVILRVDGGFKSGVDVLMAATMGADEYGFGSVAMIATGCVMARICHTNNCPVGVASQREELRARFPGVPGDLVNFFLEEVRGMLAQLGYEKLDDIIGRTDLFRPRDISLVKTQHLDLGYILSNVGLPKWTSTMIRNQDVHTNGPVLDDILLADPEISEAIGNEKMVHKTIKIYNVDRAVCGRIAGVVAKKYGDTGFAGQLNITFTGSAGQSFGCFLTPGMNIRLVGEANDYVGKSISGGELVVTPAENTGFCPEDATIVGNTCLYGATGGQIFVRGKAGERFAVRNSLAQAVVEGTGDHCCEYMTGGCVVVLGKVGRNVAAGMTGGLAYFLDEDDSFIPKVNREIVKIQRVNAPVGLPSLWSIKEALDDFNSGKDSGLDLSRLLSDCIAAFKHDPHYRDDTRFLKICNAKPAEWVTKAHAFFLERMSELVSSTHEVDNGQCIQFESHINPWSNSTMKALLKKITPRLVKFDGYHATNKAYSGKVALSSLKKSSRNKTIEIGRTKYQITGCAGQGAFAEVYKAYVNCNPDDVVALKIQKPAFPWEFFMHCELDERISDKERSSFGFAQRMNHYSDCSILVCDYIANGTLQDVINSFAVTGKSMEEELCIYYTIEMLYMLETLHDVDIIHGDFKPDNLLIRYSRDFLTNSGFHDRNELTEDGFQDRSGPWLDQGLCLVDWGRGIDLRLFPENIEFKGDCRTSGFRCVEMQENKPWKFQVDTYGLCVVVHMMLHSSYMEIYKKPSPDGGYVYQPKASFKRYWKVELWKNFFVKLLNSNPGCNNKKLLQNLRESFQEYICSDPHLLKKPSDLLAKQRKSMCSA
ncbi:hypothetical protein ACLB2K_063291 [Fragaria x ananassa]